MAHANTHAAYNTETSNCSADDHCESVMKIIFILFKLTLTTVINFYSSYIAHYSLPNILQYTLVYYAKSISKIQSIHKIRGL